MISSLCAANGLASTSRAAGVNSSCARGRSAADALEQSQCAIGGEVIGKKNVGSPEDIAAAVAFLASKDAKFITGASLAVDGARLAKL
jgi:NAD(P)-dependent dehydrogenase (short-subunit alcohol dehydrogenase family)